MTNDEIDLRNRMLVDEISKHGTKSITSGRQSTTTELELLNMSMIGIISLLGEIAKRLPDRSRRGSDS